jgi:hypothetical protein
VRWNLVLVRESLVDLLAGIKSGGGRDRIGVELGLLEKVGSLKMMILLGLWRCMGCLGFLNIVK